MSVGSTAKADNDRNKNDRSDWKKTLKGTQVQGGASPDTTFHHLIPYNNIWPTWNKLLSSADPETLDRKSGEVNDWRGTEAGSAQACLRMWLELLGHAKPDEALDLVVDAHGGGTPLDREMQDWLSVNLLWTGWNIVEGPLNTIRADDPDEKYDDFATPLSLIGLDRQALVARAVQNLDTAFTTFRTTRKEIKALRKIMVQDDATAKEKTEKSEKIGAGVLKRQRTNKVKLPNTRAEYEETFKTLATSFEGVLNAVKTSGGCSWKEPLTTIDLRMWVYLDPPRVINKPWVTGTMENQAERVKRSLMQGFANVKAIQAALNT